MDKKVKDLHEKITDVYNTMWVAYKNILKMGMCDISMMPPLI